MKEETKMSIVITGNADPKEAQAYVEYLEEKYNRKLNKLDINMRIRRITGYLVGTMDHWNDAKTAEEADRVKHSLGDEGKMESLS